VLTPECLFVMNTCQCASVRVCQLFLLPLIQEMALQQLLASCESDEVTSHWPMITVVIGSVYVTVWCFIGVGKPMEARLNKHG